MPGSNPICIGACTLSEIIRMLTVGSGKIGHPMELALDSSSLAQDGREFFDILTSTFAELNALANGTKSHRTCERPRLSVQRQCCEFWRACIATSSSPMAEQPLPGCSNRSRTTRQHQSTNPLQVANCGSNAELKRPLSMAPTHPVLALSRQGTPPAPSPPGHQTHPRTLSGSPHLLREHGVKEDLKRFPS